MVLANGHDDALQDAPTRSLAVYQAEAVEHQP
jgi:hypothetical protein